MKRRLTKHDQMPQTSSEVLTLGLIIVAHDSAEELAPDVPTAGPRLGRVLSRDFGRGTEIRRRVPPARLTIYVVCHQPAQPELPASPR